MKPMLSGTLKKISDIKFPVWCTPKLDGIRCLIINGEPVSRTLKPIRNKYIQATMEGTIPDSLDGELLLKHNAPFNEVSSAIMKTAGSPDFVYAVFDTFMYPDMGYLDRMEGLIELNRNALPSYVMLLEPVKICDKKEFKEYEKECLEKGFEGVMLRSADGKYKFGRSTVNQGWLLKWKNFQDDEARVVGFLERLHNDNEATTNALGRTERSSHKENLQPMGTLGALLAEWNGMEFKIGTGLDDATRQEIWNNREKYAGHMVKFKYQPHGVKSTPRFPVFLGWRDEEDI